jgi:hypothetical protein
VVDATPDADRVFEQVVRAVDRLPDLAARLAASARLLTGRGRRPPGQVIAAGGHLTRPADRAASSAVRAAATRPGAVPSSVLATPAETVNGRLTRDHRPRHR